MSASTGTAARSSEWPCAGLARGSVLVKQLAIGSSNSTDDLAAASSDRNARCRELSF